MKGKNRKLKSSTKNSFFILLLIPVLSLLSCANQTKKVAPAQSEIIYVHQWGHGNDKTIIIGSNVNDVYRRCNFLNAEVFHQDILVLTPEAVRFISMYISNKCQPLDSLSSRYSHDLFFSIYRNDTLQQKWYSDFDKKTNEPFNGMVKGLYDDSLQVDALCFGNSLYYNHFTN